MHALAQASHDIFAANSTGPTASAVDQFEQAFGLTVEAHHAVALDSPSSALRLSLEALGLRHGDEVITSPYNSQVPVEVIASLGARPVFVDVEEYSLNINSRLIPGAITGRTKAILAVHTAGLPSDIPTIHQIATRHGLRVIEDATCAFPAEYRGTLIGGMSAFTYFGFQTFAHNGGDHGGILCTNNSEWAALSRKSPHRMQEELAAAALAKLPTAESMWTRRSEIAREYNHAFVEMPELQIPADRFDSEHAWQLYMLRLNLEHLAVGREQFIDELIKQGVDARVHFVPLHVHPFCRETYGYRPEDFPIAYREHLREVSLPIAAEMQHAEVARTVAAVGTVLMHSRGRIGH